MNTSKNKILITHPIILASVAVVIAVAIGSAFYYENSTNAPHPQAIQSQDSGTLAVTGSGIVEPAENPDLAFASGGRVASVYAKVGEKVSQGTLLSSLDTAVLSAERAQAQANVDVAQAHLAEILTGARQEDIYAKQTAVDQATTTLSSLYVTVATNILQSYDKASSGFSQNTDNLFNEPNGATPTLVFTTTNTQFGIDAVHSRLIAQDELVSWQDENKTFSAFSSRDQIETALNTSLKHLFVLRDYGNQLLTALSSGLASNSFTQSSISAAQVSVGAYRDGINTLIATLQSEQQQIVSAKLAIQLAVDALHQTTASSTPEQISAQQATVVAAQANVDSIDAQIQNNIIVAPFSGTVASVHIKSGDIVTANTPAISLSPEGALQISVFFSEIDITKIHVGDVAHVTLDAYGNGRVFEARVASIDSAPSSDGKETGYKATFQFLKSDPAITSGMTANITIPLNK